MKYNNIVASALLSFVVSCVGMVSCSEHHTEGAHDEHEHEHAGVQITIYGEEYELYAEADPFAVGQESNIITHFTRLSDFKPYEGDETASVELNVAGGTAQSEAETKEQPGIFHLKLTPSKAGAGTLIFRFQGNEFSAPVEVFASDEQADEAAEHSKASSANGVAFSKEQSWKVDFATETTPKTPFGKLIETLGRVKSSQSGEQILTSHSAGVVSIASASLLPGSKVTRGAKLFDVKSSGLLEANTEVQYQSAKSEYESAKNEYERKLSLASSQIVSRRDLEEARNAYEKAKAGFESFSKGYKAGAVAVVSGLNGYLTDIYVSNGEYVEAGTMLGRVASSNRMVIEASLPARYYSDLKDITSANFTFADSQTLSLEELHGKILSASNSVSEEQPMLKVNFEIDSRAGLLSGSFIKVYIKTRNPGDALSVANGAITEEMGDYFVYKQITPELFEKTQVVLGGNDGLRTEVLSGLSEGDRVVSRGAIIVKLAAAAGKLDAHSGHVH